MSHCFDARCETHGHIMGTTGCPERECGGRSHGSTNLPCRPECPEWAGE